MELKNLPKKFFLLISFFACFTCFARPDFNLPLFAFAYLLWDIDRPQSQRIRLLYVFIFTWFIDFIWLIYWGPFWNSPVYKLNWTHRIQNFVLCLSVINFLLKFSTIIICILGIDELKAAIQPSHMIHYAKNIFNPDALPPPETS